MAGPVVLLGAAFPFAESLVARDLPTLGRTTGRLLGASIAGNVLGTVITGFFLIDRFGTAGTYVVLSIPMLALGLWAASLATPRRVSPLRGAVAAVAVVLIFTAPSNSRLWSMLLGAPDQNIVLAEDRSCAAALVSSGPQLASLTINGRIQNGYPFSDFHVMLGLLPALAHDDPQRALAIGYGIGSTSYGLIASERVSSLTSVEICGGLYELSEHLAQQGAPELRRLTSDDGHRRISGDGRKHLLRHPQNYDLVVPDTLLPNTAGSNNLHSVEFFELISSRLDDDGILAVWSASDRTVNSATTTFPYVVRLVGGMVDRQNTSKIVLASRTPIDLDEEVLLQRFDRLPRSALPSGQRARLRSLMADLDVECFNDGSLPPRPGSFQLNLDLRPRDEYFINGRGIMQDDRSIVRTCDGKPTS
jgi:spermidine synthase